MTEIDKIGAFTKMITLGCLRSVTGRDVTGELGGRAGVTGELGVTPRASAANVTTGAPEASLTSVSAARIGDMRHP